ncbi:MAG: hypothetical protein APR62_03115 [Smithella sp. SDB]|nr:MAG: hypothetical protein APR62_03115 [Smithella sp. SDB]
MNRVSFFIDGFNVFHALDCEKSYHKYKWLDYSALAKCFVSSRDTIADIFYFTAYAEWSQDKKMRHQLLIRALTMKGVKIVLGKFKLRDKECRLCRRTYQTFEEKQTDVNISVKLFQSAYDDTFDTGILVTGDSDIVPAIRAVKESFPAKRIGVVIPIGRSAEDMKNACDFHMKMKEKHLRDSQFPDSIVIDPAKSITLNRPATWK